MGWTADDAPWWTRAVVYQVYPRSFADADGDGYGDLPGVLAHLDHLEALGVDVVWLSPIYPSPQDDNGYDISDYQGVDPMFGTLADLDDLVAQLHERGMRLVMDLVVNHTSDAHPWFQSSRSKDDPKRDWYWWRPARPGLETGAPGAEPTNWESFFSGSAWQLDDASGEYFLHLFSVRQPDLNWENPQVRQAVYAMMRWWLDRGVDGFRMDVINAISKAVEPGGSLPDGAVTHGAYGDGTPFYLHGPRLHEFLAEMHREVLTGRDEKLITVGEMPGVTIDEAREFTDPSRAELDMVFQFEHVSLDHGPGGKFDPRPLRLTDLKASFGRWQAGMADVGWNSLYWDNHDQPRIVSRWGDESPESAKALATLLHLHRGTPYVYQGEELGMTNAHFTKLDDYRDIESLRYATEARTVGTPEGVILHGIGAMGRDNARTPMQWDAGPQAGFTTGTPWIAVNPNHTWLNAAAQRGDDRSVFHHYRELVRLRHELPVVALGDFRMLLPQDEHVYAFTRRLDDDELLVLVNVSDAERLVPVGELPWSTAEVGAGEVLVGARPEVAGAELRLAAWQSVVLRHAAR